MFSKIIRTYGKITWICAAFLLVLALPAGAIENDGSAGSDRDSVSILPFGFYTSDTGAAVGCMSVYERAGSNGGTSLRLYGGATYTWMKQAELYLDVESSWSEDRYRLEIEGGFFNTPSEFYGFGQVDDCQEAYTVQKLEARAAFSRKMYHSLFIGPAVSMKAGKFTDVEDGGVLSAYIAEAGNSEYPFGGGCSLMWDTRSDALYPLSGTLLLVEPLFFPDRGAAGESFQRIECDGRLFFNPVDGIVIALRGYGIFSSGDVPFLYLPEMGGLFLGRGYPYGRFRAENLLALQGEIRWKFTRRWGCTAFIEAGEAASGADDFKLSGIRPSAGAGLRFSVNPPSEVHIRLDVGFTPESYGVYITLMEAF